MDFIIALWIPILASAAAVWFVSALCWMAIGHHNKDTATMPGEQEFVDTVKRLNIPPGNYGFPDFKKCKEQSKGSKGKWPEGPMGLLRVWGPVSMGTNMALTFGSFLLVSVVVAYLGWAALKHTGETFGHVMQVLGTAGVLAYCFSSLPNDIWFQKSKRAMLMNFIDGVAFGLVTGAVFAWLWPK
jgi:hypothetical protein